jgi:hypothetical protein
VSTNIFENQTSPDSQVKKLQLVSRSGIRGIRFSRQSKLLGNSSSQIICFKSQRAKKIVVGYDEEIGEDRTF